MFRTTVFSTCLATAPLLLGQTLDVHGGSYLGVGVIEVDEAAARRAGLPQVRGVEVARVAQGSPAERAGLEPGDVVTRFRDEDIEGVEHFVRLVRETPIGRQVAIEIAASGGRRTATATIGERRSTFARMAAPQMRLRLPGPVDVDIPRPAMLVRSGSLGATLESVSGEFARFFGVGEGVLVREVEAGGAAGRAGLQAGDVVTAVNGSAVRSTSDIRMELSRAAGEKARVEVVRAKTRRELELETGRRTVTRPLRGVRQVSQPN